MRVLGEVARRVLIRSASLALLALVACRPSPSPSPPQPLPPVEDIPLEDEPLEEEPVEDEPQSDTPDEPPVETDYVEARRLRGDDHEAHYDFEGDAFTTDLELHVTVDDGSSLSHFELGHPGGPMFERDGPTCVTFEYEDALRAQIRDHGAVGDGRRLLEVWVSCLLGEDIISVDMEIMLLLDDGKQLEQIWSGHADYHGSHVCATYENLEFRREGSQMVVTKTAIGEIYEPGETAYDCENAREFVEPRGIERIPLP